MNYVISIINPDALPVLAEICQAQSLPLTVTMHGRGTAVQSMRELLGIESVKKRIVMTIASQEKTAAFIKAARRQLHIGVPGHGIVIAVPIKSIGGGKTVAYLNGGSPEASYTPSLNYRYELIIAIANEGSTDLVMNAARAAGAGAALSSTARAPQQRTRRSFIISPSRRKRKSCSSSPGQSKRPLSCRPS